MKDLTPALIAEKAKSEVEPYILIDIGAYYYTDKPEGYSYGGHSYLYMPISFGDIRGSEAQPFEDGTIEIGNANNVMSAIILNNGFKEATVKIREIYLDSSGGLVGAETLFYGKVSGKPACNEMRAVIRIVPQRNPWSAKCPRRRISKHCGWKFKDDDCAYSGAETVCNKTWARCTALSNTARFGGFRFIPERGTQFIYGGKVIKIR